MAKSFSDAAILDNVSFDLLRQSKAGLVGENGSGKSTILKLITGALEPDSGDVTVARSAHIYYVPQMPDLRSRRTTYEEILTACPGLFEVRERMLFLESKLADTAPSKDVTTAYAEAVAEFSEAGGYQFERDSQEALRALGLSEEQIRLPVDQLSGGEQARVALAKALVANPSVLLLDEPDNHLDIEGIRWLEGILRRYRGALLLVTHDRELLDRVVNSIIEIEDGKITVERGNFANFE